MACTTEAVDQRQVGLQPNGFRLVSNLAPEPKASGYLFTTLRVAAAAPAGSAPRACPASQATSYRNTPTKRTGSPRRHPYLARHLYPSVMNVRDRKRLSINVTGSSGQCNTPHDHGDDSQQQASRRASPSRAVGEFELCEEFTGRFQAARLNRDPRATNRLTALQQMHPAASRVRS